MLEGCTLPPPRSHDHPVGGAQVLSLCRAAQRYARSWFIVDLIAVLPWESIAADFSFLVLIKTARRRRAPARAPHALHEAAARLTRVKCVPRHAPVPHQTRSRARGGTH